MNEALKHLGEEHRLGMIRAEEFRQRRRALLESWGDLGETTSPGGITRPSMTTTQTNPASLRSSGITAHEPARRNGVLVVAVIVGVVVVAIAAWTVLKPEKVPRAPGSSIEPVIKRSPQLLAVMREATAFRNRNSWDAADTEGFLVRWRDLTPADRKVAQQEPSLRSLLHELEQNIAAERQSLEFSPSDEGRVRLERLQAFAEELTETDSR